MKQLTSALMVSTILLCSVTARASSWTVVQEAILPNTIILQNNTTNSTQAINGIYAPNDAITNTSEQTINSSQNIEFIQKSGTNNSYQAANRLVANTIIGKIGNKMVTQVITTSSDLSLKQDNGIGANNTQVGNEAVSSRQIYALSQRVEVNNGEVILLQYGGNNNIQAANLIQASNISNIGGAIKQKINIKSMTFEQKNSTNNLQAGNALLILGSSSGGTIYQKISTKDEIKLMQSNSSGSIQAANYVGTAP
jgi:hypothetical protein